MRERKGPSVGDVAVAVVELGDDNFCRVGGGGIGGWEEEADELQKEGRMGLDNGECPAVDDIRVCSLERRWFKHTENEMS